MEHRDAALHHQVTLSELVTPQMANNAGTLFGGALLALADKAAYVCAARYCGEDCVTASFDQVSFLKPVHLGELITFFANLIYVGKSSMIIEITAVAESLQEQQFKTVATCYVTMVAVKDGKSCPIPRPELRSKDEKRSYARGYLHKEASLKYAKTVKEIEERMNKMSEEEIKTLLESAK